MSTVRRESVVLKPPPDQFVITLSQQEAQGLKALLNCCTMSALYVLQLSDLFRQIGNENVECQHAYDAVNGSVDLNR